MFSNLEGIWLCSEKSTYLLKVFGVKSASKTVLPLSQSLQCFSLHCLFNQAYYLNRFHLLSEISMMYHSLKFFCVYYFIKILLKKLCEVGISPALKTILEKMFVPTLFPRPRSPAPTPLIQCKQMRAWDQICLSPIPCSWTNVLIRLTLSFHRVQSQLPCLPSNDTLMGKDNICNQNPKYQVNLPMTGVGQSSFSFNPFLDRTQLSCFKYKILEFNSNLFRF